MFDWLQREKRPPARLPGLLAGYPPFPPIHLGLNGADPEESGPVLTYDQARENSLAYREAVPARLELLRQLLTELGVDAAMAYADADAFVRALHPSLLAELPSAYRPELADRHLWSLSDRSGPRVVHSLLVDLAMLSADVLIRAKPGCFLGMDLDPEDRDMGMYRQPCLLGLTDRLFPDTPECFWLDGEWFGYFRNMDDPGRLAAADRVGPETYRLVIGGVIPQRLDRYIVDPKLDERLRTTWLGEAA